MIDERMATVTISPSPPFTSLLFISAPRSLSSSSHKPCNPTPALADSAVCRPVSQMRRTIGRISWRSSRSWRASASASGDALPSESAVEKAQQMVPADADGFSSVIISALLTIAFVGLSLLTVGIIYLAVQDFLQKRERDKFEKEEAAKKKKGGKKAKVKARSGPRGFGQKIEEDDD